MTFDDWMLTKDCRYCPTDDSPMIRKLHECWDAAQKYGEVEQQLAEREKQIVMLQEALLYMHYEKCNYMAINHLGDPLKETAARIALKALDATQDLSGLVLCDAEVNDWDDDVPLYRRKQP